MNNCFAEFLQNAGLYDSIDITENNITELCELIGGKVKLSEYCVRCEKISVFFMEPIEFISESSDGEREVCALVKELDIIQWKQETGTFLPWEEEEDNWYWSNSKTKRATRIMCFSFTYAMDDSHHLDYIVRTDGNAMVKIGQFPSVADLTFPELDEFKKDIDKFSRKELRRAIGLHAQGIGAGSYVYLRRIFERILETAKGRAEQDKTVDLSNYESKRVSEKVKLLREYLPEMINSNPVIYGIVSKGIHELSEDECIKYFPILQDAIFMILRQWAQKRKEQETIKKIETSLSKISTELSE